MVPEPSADYGASPPVVKSGLGGAKVFFLRPKPPVAAETTDQARDKPAQTGPASLGPESGPRLTLRDCDWGSITTIWADTPDSLHTTWTQIHTGLRSGDHQQIALATWLVMTIAIRGCLHLASWALEHPLRTGAVLTIVGFTCLILAI